VPFSLEGFKGCNAARILVWPQAVIPGLVDEQFGLQVRAAGEVQLPPFFLEGPDKNAGSVFEHPQDGPKGRRTGIVRSKNRSIRPLCPGLASCD